LPLYDDDDESMPPVVSLRLHLQLQRG